MDSGEYWRTLPQAESEFCTTGDLDQFAKQEGYEKASFIRMRNISVGYTVPSKLLKNVQIKHAKIYAQVINPFDLHQAVAGLDLDTGKSYFNRSWVVGLELGF